MGNWPRCRGSTYCRLPTYGPLFMSLESALRFLAGRIDYERAMSMPCSEAAFKLDRMRELLRRLDDPQRQMPIVHIAGTKGKGSTAAMLSAVLSAAGLRTGLFTSPHLDRVEERMAIDGRACPPDEFAELIERVRPAVEAMDREGELGPTYFEILTAVALCHFALRRVDAAVLEVGLGGRLDSTNVCAPVLSIITSISLDHTRQLGETLSAIAAEKAGIIKPGVPVISGVADPEPREVIQRVARQNGCRLVRLGVDFDYLHHPPLHLEEFAAPARFDYRSATMVMENVALGLLGRHQAANAAMVLAAVEELRRQGWAIPESAVRRGLAEVSWPARIEVLSRKPTVVLDAAHNAASIQALVETLAESFSARKRFLIFATTREKDVGGMLPPLLDHFDHIILTRYQENPRGIPPEELFNLISPLPLGEGQGVRASVEIAPTPFDAWSAVHRLARPADLVCITGSFFIAAELRRQIAARPLGGR